MFLVNIEYLCNSSFYAPDSRRSSFIASSVLGTTWGMVLGSPLCGITAQYLGWDYGFHIIGKEENATGAERKGVWNSNMRLRLPVCWPRLAGNICIYYEYSTL